MSGDDDGDGDGLLGCLLGVAVGLGDVVLQAAGANAAADNPVTSSRLEITRPA
jgi:hypothetical protein